MLGFNAGEKAHQARGPSRDVQTNQLTPASGRDIDDVPRSLGVQHDAPGHLRLDGHGAVDAERCSFKRVDGNEGQGGVEHMSLPNS